MTTQPTSHTPPTSELVPAPFTSLEELVLKYTTLTSQTHTLHISEEMGVFWESLLAIFQNPTQTAEDFFATMHSPANPLLVARGEGVMIPNANRRAPMWRPMRDLLARKEIKDAEAGGEDGKSPFTMTPAEVAEELGISTRAVRKACVEGRLHAVQFGSRWKIDRGSLAQYRIKHKRRGPKSQSANLGSLSDAAPKSPKGYPVSVRVGHKTGSVCFIKNDGERRNREDFSGPAGKGWAGQIHDWTEIAILTTKDKRRRFFLLKPSKSEGEFEYDGFYVRGMFEIAQKENNHDRAEGAWKAFKPQFKQ